MVCGNCCTLTESSAKVWAICLECDRKKGRSLVGAWVRLLMWLMVPIGVLAVLTALLAWLSQR
jgi:hypothetical protein